jgi:hypothetical protein
MHGKKMMQATMLHCKYARTMRRVRYGTVQWTRRSGELMHRSVSWIPILMCVQSERGWSSCGSDLYRGFPNNSISALF